WRREGVSRRSWPVGRSFGAGPGPDVIRRHGGVATRRGHWLPADAGWPRSHDAAARACVANDRAAWPRRARGDVRRGGIATARRLSLGPARIGETHGGRG